MRTRTFTPLTVADGTILVPRPDFTLPLYCPSEDVRKGMDYVNGIIVSASERGEIHWDSLMERYILVLDLTDEDRRLSAFLAHQKAKKIWVVTKSRLMDG